MLKDVSVVQLSSGEAAELPPVGHSKANINILLARVSNMELKVLSWPEVEEYLKERGEVFLPAGSVEEHGYHLPLSTDKDIACAVCSKLSRLTGILVAPPVWYGYSRSTRAYRGTVMLGRAELKHCTRSLLEGFRESGFSTVYLVSGHFSRDHISGLAEACEEAEGIEAKLLDFSQLDFSDILESEPMHACEAETSLMLYLCQEQVDMERAVDEEISFEGDRLRKTKSGVFGSPTLATGEKGRRLFERIISELCRWL